MEKKMHPGVDGSLLKKMEEHAKIRDAGFINHFSVSDAIKMDAEDGVPVDESLLDQPVNSIPEIPAYTEESFADEDESMEDEDTPPIDPEQRFEWTMNRIEKNFVGHPTKQEMRMWKSNHGDVFVCNFGDKLFVYRYLKRIEWTQMQSRTRMEEMTSEQLEHMFIEKCLLFPRVTPELLYNLPAGLVGMLSQQIQMNSGFMNPEYLSQFTIKL